jgi:lipocalin
MFVLAILFSAVILSANAAINPDTVDSLDVPKYLGLWYQMSADQIVYSTFEKDAYCATAFYGDNGQHKRFSHLKKILNQIF